MSVGTSQSFPACDIIRTYIPIKGVKPMLWSTTNSTFTQRKSRKCLLPKQSDAAISFSTIFRLNEVDSIALQSTLKNLIDAFKRSLGHNSETRKSGTTKVVAVSKTFVSSQLCSWYSYRK